MRLPRFAYFDPKTLPEALSMLSKDPTARVLAGGTDLLVNMKHKVESPAALVNIKAIGDLDGVEQKNGTLRIGARTSLKRVYQHPLVADRMPALAQASAAVGSYHHQVMGTLAGNLCQQNRCKYYNQSRAWRSSRPTCFKAGGEICHVMNKEKVCHSCYCGDVAPALLVLDARIELAGPAGTREIPLAELYSGEGKSPLTVKPGEILTRVLIPAEAGEGLSGYLKFANRGSIDFAIVGLAYRASKSGRDIRVAFTAVDCKPLRADKVEAFLKGKPLNTDTVAEAAALAAKAAKPVRTSVYSPNFKRRMMGQLLKDALSEVSRRSGS